MLINIIIGSRYAKNGIKEYWIVNLKQRQLEVFRKPVLDGETADYTERIILAENELISPLERPVARLKVKDMLP
jgi:Uma2 family endonuclease